MTIQAQAATQPRVYCVACGHRQEIKPEKGTWRRYGDSGVVCESCSKAEHSFEPIKLVVRHCHQCGTQIAQSPIITCNKCIQEGRNGRK